MRKSLLRNSLLCGSLVMLSGCYSNGKFHSPTWNEMAWWRSHKSPDTSLAAAPSVGGRPSDEAMADRNSPGARATSAPAYDAAAVAYNQPPAGDSRYPDAGYPNTGYPDTGYAGPAARSTGGTSWDANGNAAASVASNPYANSGASGYDTGSRYDGRGTDHAQRTPYDSTYPGTGNTYSTHGASNAADRRPYSANDEPANSGGGDYAAPSGPHDNPYYNPGERSASPPASSRYDEGKYTPPDRYAPAPNAGASTDKYTSPNYETPQDAASRYNTEGYRDMTGDRYATDGARSAATTQPPPAYVTNPAANARTADSRNSDRSSGNDYQPGKTGYQPGGVPDYAMPTADGRIPVTPPPYQPGGTSRYQGAASNAGSTNSTAGPYSGNNRYAEPLPSNRYNESPANSSDGAARRY